MRGLAGKVVIVTGGAGGLGRAVARRLVEEEATVVVTDVGDEGGAVAAQLGDGASYLPLDVTDEAAWERVVAATVEEHGRLHGLVNNAGILRRAPLVDAAVADLRAQLEVNAVGCFLGMQAAARAMDGGAIVNVSSIAGLVGAAGMVGYVASKFAVRGMTRAAALDLGPAGIRVNSVHPGGIDTPMARSEGFEDVDWDRVYRRQPVPRLADPAEVAAVVAFLLSDEAAYCTGSEFVVDGGATAGR